MRAHLQATIGKARHGNMEQLADFVGRAGSLEPAAAGAAAERAMAIIEGIPDLLEAVAEASYRRGIALLVQPLLDGEPRTPLPEGFERGGERRPHSCPVLLRRDERGHEPELRLRLRLPPVARRLGQDDDRQ